MTTDRPLVSFGVPVFDGERFVAEALASVLTQTVTDIEVVVADNASTDSTVRIVERLADTDQRIRLVRRPANIGVVENFDDVCRIARGRFFAWAAHDDLRAPEFTERCLVALADNPSAVLAYSRSTTIDEDGATLRSPWGAHPDLQSSSPRVRFRAALARPTDPMPLPLFGVMRSEALARTGLMVPGPHYDRALVAELALHGRFVEVPEPLFRQREHSARMGPSISADGRETARRLGSRARLPQWQLLGRHLASVRRRPAGVGGVGLFAEVARWGWRERDGLLTDVLVELGEHTRRAPVVGPRLSAWIEARPQRRWERRTRRLETRLTAATADGACIVLVDDDSFGPLHLGDRTTVPLWLRDGVSWGVPGREIAIIDELEQRRRDGATHVAVAWPAQWVLDFHGAVRDHLARCASETARSDDLVVFAFRSPAR